MKASTFYAYSFVSPQPLYALIREELRSYFDSGAIDDVLFSVWTERCLKKLGKGTYKIVPALLSLEDFTCRLPEDFAFIRELWLTCQEGEVITLPNSTYTQIVSTSVRIDNFPVGCDVDLDCSKPPVIQAIYKTNNQVLCTWKVQHLLRPGNLSVFSDCGLDCRNVDALSHDTFDIRNGNIITNFRSGDLFLMYYAFTQDEQGYQMIPDEVHIQEYLEAYIKYKCFEQLSNQVVDETAKQIEGKLQRADQIQAEKFIMAETWMKKETVYDKQRKIEQTRTRNNRYRLR